MRRPSLDIRQVPRRQNTRSLPPVTPDDVWRIIAATPAKTSPLDIVPISTIKLCIDTFVPIIVRLSNLSFAEGRFRECYKTAQVAPLLKKHVLDATQEACAGQNGSSKLPSDFEPEHHLQNTGKISAGSASHHRLKSRNLSTGHFSYRAGHSTETALLGY